MIIQDDDKIKITIEASTPEMASRLLYTLKREIEPLTGSLPTTAIDLDTTMRIMGLDVVLKLKEPHRRPAVYRHEVRG